MEINENLRLNELYDSKLLESTNGGVFQEELIYLKKFFNVDAGFVSVVTSERSYINSSFGFGFKRGASEVRSKAFCSMTIVQDKFLEIIEPKTKEELQDFSMFNIHSKVKYVLAYPLRTPIGAVVGTLTVVRFTNKSLDKKEKEGVSLIKKHIEDKVALFQSVSYKKEIENQKAIIEAKTKEIEYSSNYARALQLAANKELKSFSNECYSVFMYNRPKEIVSGDFSFYIEKDGVFYLAAADCTGHGLPGALLTVMCSNVLTKVVNSSFNILPLGKILDEVNREVKKWMTFGGTSRHDGMGISILKVDLNSKNIEISGANSSVLFVNNKEAEVIKTDRIPIGNYRAEKSFATISKSFSKGDSIYLYSDGIKDQFGGEFNKKMRMKGFKELIFDLNKLGNTAFEEKELYVEDRINDWMNTTEQIDDMILIELKFE